MNAEHRPFDVISQLAALRRYARSLVRNGSDAEDLVHDALVKAYERRTTFRSGGNLRAWLMSIVHNTHVDRHRAGRIRQGQETGLDGADIAIAASQDENVRLHQVRTAFMSLPEEQREALHLVAIEDMSYQDAADALQIPIGTLMSRVSRARARLRTIDAGEQERPATGHLKIVGGKDD